MDKKVFVGNIDSKIDGNGRIILPPIFKENLNPDSEGRKFIVIEKDRDLNCLSAYSTEQWTELVENAQNQIDRRNPAHRVWLDMYTNSVKKTLVTSNGRMKISDEFIQHAKLEGDIILSGQNDTLRIWSKDEFNKNLLSEDIFNQIGDSIDPWKKDKSDD